MMTGLLNEKLNEKLNKKLKTKLNKKNGDSFKQKFSDGANLKLITGKLKESLLLINGRVRRDYETYLNLIPEVQHTKMNWLHRDFLPTIILLPSLSMNTDSLESVKLAQMLELSYIAQQVHSETPPNGGQGDYQMSILIGDYLCATAFGILVENQQTKWLERLGNAICRMNEGKTVRSQWQDRNFVPIDEKIENLHKEYGELAALAGLMGAETAGLNQEETQIMTAFAFYAGVLQGMMLHGYNEAKPAALESYIDYCEQYLCSLPSSLRDSCKTLILDQLVKPSALSSHPLPILVYDKQSNLA